MKNINTNISIQLDTIADMLVFDIKQYETLSCKIGNLQEALDQIRRTLGSENHIIKTIKLEIAGIVTLADYWCVRCDKNFDRYTDLIEDLAEKGETYRPERGADWSPGWFASDTEDYDKPETDEDPKYRENMAATSGDDMTKADYIDRYNMEDDR